MKIKNKIKKFWDNQPCNIKHSNKKKFSKEYFNEVKKKRFFVEHHIPNFAEFKKYKNKNILEIGCGIGTDAVEFIKNKAKYYGTELSKHSLKIAQKRINVLNLERFKPIFLLEDAEKMEKIFKLKIKFDLIYSFGVIHHTPNMAKVFNNIHKIANKKTEIKLMLYAKNSYKNFMLKNTIYRYEAQKDCPVVYKTDMIELNKLIKEKFKIIEAKQDFIFPYKIDKYKKNIYEKIDHFKYMPKKIFKKLEENIGEHFLIKLKKI